MADFLSKIKDGLTKGAEAVSTGSRNVIEKTKLLASIKSLEGEIKDLSVSIGTKLYNWCATNPEGDIPREEYEDFVKEIAVRNEQIIKHKARISELGDEIEQVMSLTCSCGQTNPPGTKFCPVCGKPISRK